MNESDLYHAASRILAGVVSKRNYIGNVEAREVSTAVSLALALRDEVRAATVGSAVAELSRHDAGPRMSDYMDNHTETK